VQERSAKAGHRGGSDFLHRKAKTETVVFVTIVPADGIAGKGELEADQHQRNVRRWKEKLGRAGVTWFFGASDWSWNEDKAGRYAHHWSHHVCGFTSTSDPEELKKRLKQQFPNSTVSPKPVRLDVWDGDDRAIKYICKSKFLRRIGIQGKRFNKGIGKHRACRATDKQPLRSAEKRELLLHLDQIGLQARLVLRQLQIVHRGSAGPAAVERGGNGRARGGAGKW
jgi:hypothetical protein